MLIVCVSSELHLHMYDQTIRYLHQNITTVLIILLNSHFLAPSVQILCVCCSFSIQLHIILRM